MSTLAPAPPRRWRRRRTALVLLALAVVAPIVALPWALGTPPARRWLLGKANRALAPGGLEVASFRFSWFGPTRLTGFALRDGRGDRVVAAPSVEWDRNLGQILFDRPRLGTLDLGAAALDVERAADGSIDLYEALRPILTGNPKTDLTILMTGGTFRLQGPGLSRPVRAEHADLWLWIPAAPQAVAWSLELAARGPDTGHETRDTRREALTVAGRFDRWRPGPGGRSDLLVSLSGTRWPLDLEVAGISASAKLDGRLDLQRSRGLWKSSGSTALLDLDAAGPRLAGDRLRLDRVGATWAVAETAEGWSVRRLGVESSLVTMKSSGIRAVPVGQAARFEGRLDLAALARQLPHALRLPEGRTPLRGSAGFQVDLRDDAEGRPVWDVAARVADLLWDPETIAPAMAPLDLSARIAPGADGLRIGGRLELHDPVSDDAPAPHRGRSVTVTAQTLYRADSDRIDLTALTLDGPFGSLQASGHLDEPGHRRLVDLRGTWAPDWGGINEVLARRVEPGALVEGETLSFGVQGPLAFGSWAVLWKGLHAELNFVLRGATFYGMHVGPAAIVAHSDAGRLVLEPIESTINEGRLRLEPEVVLDAEGGPLLRLGPGTTIEDAEINEQVSRQVLAYVAPILERAARPRGRVSVALTRAEIPLGPESSRQALVEGQVVFRDVEFVPGPLPRELLGLIGREEATLRIDEPVVLTIADGRVQQRGLAIPLGNLARIELEGSVDFDRNLDLTASLPIAAGMFAQRPLLADIAAGARITVPIRGTLAHPQIDRTALRAHMKDLGTSLLTRGALQGASELLFRLTRPRDPDAPPPPTAAERKAQRLERKVEKRRARPS